MGRRRLSNDDWIFDSNCFVCEAKNDAGLRIPFFHDDDADVVTAEFTLDERFSGAPSFIHGGVTLAILDEAMAWATIASAGKFAVTVRTETTFDQPVLVGKTFTVEGRVEEVTDTEIHTSGVVRNRKGAACAEARATFAILSEAQARRAIGADDIGDVGGYVRDA